RRQNATLWECKSCFRNLEAFRNGIFTDPACREGFTMVRIWRFGPQPESLGERPSKWRTNLLMKWESSRGTANAGNRPALTLRSAFIETWVQTGRSQR